MRRLIVTVLLTLDGVIEDPGGAEGGGHAGWSFRFENADSMRFKLDETLSAWSDRNH